MDPWAKWSKIIEFSGAIEKLAFKLRDRAMAFQRDDRLGRNCNSPATFERENASRFPADPDFERPGRWPWRCSIVLSAIHL